MAKTLTVNELFSGIGSQRASLERLGVEHEVVGTAEIDKFATLSYAAIYHDLINQLKTYNFPSGEEMSNYLTERNIGYDFKKNKPFSWKKLIDKITGKGKKDLRKYYLASILSNNYGDISKVEKLDYADFWTYSFPCFTKDNYVLTDKGYKTIDKVKIGDNVLTHNNTYEKVVNTFNNGIRDTVKIKGQCIDEITTTKNHKFYVREKYRKWKNENRSYERIFKEPKWMEIGKVTKDYYLGVAINQKSIIPKWNGIDFEWSDGRKTRHKNELQPLMVNKNFWWLIGRYIADGNIRSQGGVVISVEKHKLEEFKVKVGGTLNFSVAEERTTYRCHFSSKELEKFVLPFGKGAGNKRVTNTIIDLPTDLLKSLLDGYISGDGCYNEKVNMYKCSSISRELLIGLGQCVAKVYKKPYSIYKTKRPKKTKIEGRVVNQHDTYELTFKKDIRKQDNAFYEDGYVWYPFQSIKENGKEEVFDIEVENAHSFTVQNTIVHNCQDISVAGKQAGIEKGETRSGLLYEVERLLEKSKECGELPKYLMLENVKNLVGKKFKSQFEEWIQRLDELGYNTKWQILNSKHYGIPQNRERVFAISIRKDIDIEYVFPESFELSTRLKDILEKEVDEKFYISNDRVNVLLKNLEVSKLQEDLANVNQIGNCVESEGNFENPQRGRVYSTNGCSPALNCVGGGGLEPKILEPTGIDKSINNPKIIEVANCITTKDRGISNRKSEGTAVIEPVIAASRGRNPENPSDRTSGNPTEQRLEINQNGISNTITTVQKDNYVLEPKEKFGRMGRQAVETYNEKQPSFGSTINPFNKTVDDSGNCPTITTRPEGFKTAILLVTHYFRIRKLTPLECWRLMGFTDEQFYKAEKVNSNSQLYKQAGNSIVVDVLYYIFKNLFV